MGLPPRNQWGPLTRWPSANTASQSGGTPLLSPLPLLVCSVTTQEYFWIKSCVKGQIFLNTKVQNISYIKQDCSVPCSSVQWLVQCRKNQACMNCGNNLLFWLPLPIDVPTKYLHIQSTTVYVPSSELGLPQPLCRKRVCPPPRTKGWGGTPACT